MAWLVRQDFRGKLTCGTGEQSLNPNKKCASTECCDRALLHLKDSGNEKKGEEPGCKTKVPECYLETVGSPLGGEKKLAPQKIAAVDFMGKCSHALTVNCS